MDKHEEAIARLAPNTWREMQARRDGRNINADDVRELATTYENVTYIKFTMWSGELEAHLHLFGDNSLLVEYYAGDRAPHVVTFPVASTQYAWIASRLNELALMYDARDPSNRQRTTIYVAFLVGFDVESGRDAICVNSLHPHNRDKRKFKVF